MSNGEGLKNDVPKNVEDTEIPQKTPKLETENQAVNKALAKQKSELGKSSSGYKVSTQEVIKWQLDSNDIEMPKVVNLLQKC